MDSIVLCCALPYRYNRTGDTALTLAPSRGQSPKIRTLSMITSDHRFDPNLAHGDGLPPLLYAMGECSIASVEAILTVPGLNVDIYDTQRPDDGIIFLLILRLDETISITVTLWTVLRLQIAVALLRENYVSYVKMKLQS